MKNKIIPMTYDKVFKSVLQAKETRNYLIDVLSNITGIPKEEFNGNIVFKNSELSNDETKEKLKIADLIIELDKSVINLEMNKKFYFGLIDKNDRYIYKLKEGLVYPGQKEINFKRIIQINFDNYQLFDERTIIKFEMMDKECGLIRSEFVQASNVEIYHVNLKKIEQMYYNKEKLTKLEKELAIMILNDEEKLKDISKGDKELEKVTKKIVTLSKEEELAGIYIKEEQDEWIRDRYKEEGLKTGREEGLKQGRKEGIKEGCLNKQKEIAKNMLNEGMNKELIVKVTDISLDELNELL